MPGIKKKDLYYHILFALCVGIPYINYYEVTFLVWALAILLTLRKKFSLNFIQYLAYFIAIIAIAFFVSFFEENIKTLEKLGHSGWLDLGLRH